MAREKATAGNRRRSDRPATASDAQPAVRNEAPRQAPTREEIERRAYDLYVQRGGQDGSDMDDWLRAERELLTP